MENYTKYKLKSSDELASVLNGKDNLFVICLLYTSIMLQMTGKSIEEEAEAFVSEEKEVASVADAIEMCIRDRTTIEPKPSIRPMRL